MTIRLTHPLPTRTTVWRDDDVIGWVNGDPAGCENPGCLAQIAAGLPVHAIPRVGTFPSTSTAPILPDQPLTGGYHFATVDEGIEAVITHMARVPHQVIFASAMLPEQQRAHLVDVHTCGVLPSDPDDSEAFVELHNADHDPEDEDR